MALPTYGTDAAGANTYVEVIAARTDPEVYNMLRVWCATQDAILSLDGGTTDHIYVVAGIAPETISLPNRSASIQAKNAAAGLNYATLFVQVWFDPSRHG